MQERMHALSFFLLWCQEWEQLSQLAAKENMAFLSTGKQEYI